MLLCEVARYVARVLRNTGLAALVVVVLVLAGCDDPVGGFFGDPLGPTVTSPNGGEAWDLGATEPITWTSPAGVTDVRIEVFRNGAWEEIVASTDAVAGTYDWTLTGDPASDALIRVSDAAYPSASGRSDAEFTVRGVMVTAPNGGEVLIVGGDYTITWVAPGLTSDVEIRYSTDGGSSYAPGDTIATVPATDGSFLWTNIPNDPSTTCRVRVQDQGGTGLEDESDADFEIQ